MIKSTEVKCTGRMRRRAIRQENRRNILYRLLKGKKKRCKRKKSWFFIWISSNIPYTLNIGTRYKKIQMELIEENKMSGQPLLEKKQCRKCSFGECKFSLVHCAHPKHHGNKVLMQECPSEVEKKSCQLAMWRNIDFSFWFPQIYLIL